MKKIISIAVIIAVLSFFVARNQIKIASEELDYGIAPGFKVTSFTFGESKMIIPFWINNPTNFNLTISNVRLDVFVNNIFAGRIKVDKVYRLNKRDKSIVPFTVEINNVSAMNVFMNVSQYLQQSNWRDKINIAVTGSARVESGFIYISNVPIKADGSYKHWMG